ncbi:MAG: type II toxin-antitoxin system VapC family toxin [Candidatus Kariarchaeaceae archaeon]|jgi:tRNA(fMet)-specific endonuclease VapC
MKVVADTDFLIELYRGKEPALKKIQDLINEHAIMYTTSINAAELFEGAYKSKSVTTSISNVKNLLSSFIVLNFTIEDAKTFGELITRLKGKEIGAMDTLIASIAINNGSVVLTKNSLHFERTGVLITSW